MANEYLSHAMKVWQKWQMEWPQSSNERGININNKSVQNTYFIQIYRGGGF